MRRSSWTPLALCTVAALSACAQSSQPLGHSAGTLTGNNTWKTGQHNVNGTITVSNGILTVEAGSNLIMEGGLGTATSLIIGKNGGLKILGTPDKPVIITSGAAAPNRGDWGSIEFQEGSDPNSIITNSNISFGGGGSNVNGTPVGAVIIDGGAAAEISNTVIDNSKTFAVSVPSDATLNNFVGNTLVHNTLGPITVTANTAGQLLDGTYGPNDVNGIAVVPSQLTQDANWINPGTPWLLAGLTIQALTGTAVLTVSAGNTFLIQQFKGIIVQKNGALILAGTQAQPITITSANNPAARGDWQDISYYIGSIGSKNAMNFTEIDFGGGNSKGSVWLEAGAQLNMQNSTVSNSSGVGVTVTAGGQLPNFSGNSLIHNALGAMNIDVDDVRQLQGLSNTYAPNTVDGILVTGTLLHTSTDWGPLGAAYVINDDFAVDVNAGSGSGVSVLTIDAGTVLMFAPNKGMLVNENGQLNVNGTAQNGVVFTVSQEPASWDNIFIASANTNTLNYANFRFYGSSLKCAVYLNGGQVTGNAASFSQGQPCGYLECPKTAAGNEWHGNYTGFGPGDPSLLCPSI